MLNRIGVVGTDSSISTELFLKNNFGFAQAKAERHFHTQIILDALKITSGHKKPACELLGISRTTLDRRIAIYDIPTPAKGVKAENVSKETKGRNIFADMWSNNCSFEQILHIPTLNTYGISEAFNNFYESCDSADFDEIAENNKGFSCVLNRMRNDESGSYIEEHAQEIAMYCSDFQFLVQVKAVVPSNFEFNDKNEVVSYRFGGWHRTKWIMVESMDKAAEKAILFAQSIKQKAINDQLAKDQVA